MGLDVVENDMSEQQDFDIDDDKWEEVGFSESETFKFDKLGQEFIGVYKEKFETQYDSFGYVFECPDKEKDQVIYPNSYLEGNLNQMEVGDLVKITFEDKKDTGKPNKLKVYDVKRIPADKHVF